MTDEEKKTTAPPAFNSLEEHERFISHLIPSFRIASDTQGIMDKKMKCVAQCYVAFCQTRKPQNRDLQERLAWAEFEKEKR